MSSNVTKKTILEEKQKNEASLKKAEDSNTENVLLISKYKLTASVAIFQPSGFMEGRRWIRVLSTSATTSL